MSVGSAPLQRSQASLSEPGLDLRWRMGIVGDRFFPATLAIDDPAVEAKSPFAFMMKRLAPPG